MKIKFTKHTKSQLILDSLTKENLVNKTLTDPQPIPTDYNQLEDNDYILVHIDGEMAGVAWITKKLHIHWALYRKFYGKGKVIAEVFLTHILPNDKKYEGKTLIASTIPKAQHVRKILRDLGLQQSVTNCHDFYIKVQ